MRGSLRGWREAGRVAEQGQHGGYPDRVGKGIIVMSFDAVENPGEVMELN